MKVTKQTKDVETIVIKKEVVYTLELNEEQAATLFILAGQMTPADVHARIKDGLGFYHTHLKPLVRNEFSMDVNTNTIGPIYNELKEIFDVNNYKK